MVGRFGIWIVVTLASVVALGFLDGELATLWAVEPVPIESKSALGIVGVISGGPEDPGAIAVLQDQYTNKTYTIALGRPLPTRPTFRVVGISPKRVTISDGNQIEQLHQIEISDKNSYAAEAPSFAKSYLAEQLNPPDSASEDEQSLDESQSELQSEDLQQASLDQGLRNLAEREFRRLEQLRNRGRRIGDDGRTAFSKPTTGEVLGFIPSARRPNTAGTSTAGSDITERQAVRADGYPSQRYQRRGELPGPRDQRPVTLSAPISVSNADYTSANWSGKTDPEPPAEAQLDQSDDDQDYEESY